jgi:quercetin dioxygenase-like cupin family protein
MKRSASVLALCLSIVLSAMAQQSGEVEITSEPHHHLALENQYVRLFEVEVPPHQPTLLHRDRDDYMFVTLGPSLVSNELPGKAPVTLKLQDGETEFAAGDFAHVARNLADTPFRNVTIEFLQDAKAHQTPPPKWDEERGLHVLQGGTEEILFVKDGVRVSDIQLQPGGVIPKHRHDGPHLIVAVSEVNVRSDIEGKPTKMGHLKTSEFKWLEGGYTHTLTNVGKQPARFISLEFH